MSQGAHARQVKRRKRQHKHLVGGLDNEIEPPEPAKQQVVLGGLHEQALGAHAVDDLREHGTQQLFGCDARAHRMVGRNVTECSISSPTPIESDPRQQNGRVERRRTASWQATSPHLSVAPRVSIAPQLRSIKPIFWAVCDSTKSLRGVYGNEAEQAEIPTPKPDDFTVQHSDTAE